MSQTIVKGSNDQRNYKAIELPNQLCCLLISDKEADKSAASLDVNIGSIYDSKERMGLAHFLEHMLFMGTGKYPSQNEYSAFLSSNSGSDNAFTSLCDTNYHFDCSNAGFHEALDRFAQFFIEPLFDESCVNKEINAVDSEYQKNIMQDSRRKYQLFRNSALSNHPYNKFSTGSKETLEFPNIREDLIEFYRKFYSSNLMKLVIYGQEDVETLEKWAIDIFSSVKNNNITTKEFIEMPYTEENLGDIWRIFPVEDKDAIEYVWIFESFENHYKNHPVKYISHLVGHEGPNSLLSYLIDEGLALNLSSGYNTELKLFTKFTINIQLTKKGLEEYAKVSQIVFQYLKMLKSREVDIRIFREIKVMNKIKFSYKDKEDPIDYVTDLSRVMQYYPIDDILQLDYMMEEFEPNLIKKRYSKTQYSKYENLSALKIF